MKLKMMRYCFAASIFALFVYFQSVEGLVFGGPRKRNCTITPWGDWKNCRPLDDGSGVESRRRYKSQATLGGKPCPSNLTTVKTRDCSKEGTTASRITTAVLQTTISALIHPFSNAKGTSSSGNTKLPRERNANGQYCDVIKSGGRLLASGNCGTNQSVVEQFVENQTGWFGSVINRYRRQTTEQLKDVIILIDKSVSKGTRGYIQFRKKIAAALVHAMCANIDISSDRTRIGVAAFDSSYQRLIELNQYPTPSSKVHLETAIKRLRIKHGSGTNLFRAVETTRTGMFRDSSNGARHGDPRVKKILFVISDGCDNGGGFTPQQLKSLYMEDNACIVSIYVGDPDSQCAANIQSMDTECTCFQQFFFPSYKDAKKFLVDPIEAIPTGACHYPTWQDLLLSC